jgi:Type II secretion system (T2SS), protein E, N-terminal domain
LEQLHPPGDQSGVPGEPEEEAMSTPLRERPDAPLGTLIFRAGLLPAETIESALEEGVKTGKRLGEILTERGLLKEADLARLLAGQKGLEFVTLREQIVDHAAAGLFSEDQARLFRALPYAFEEGAPVVAIADPSDEVLTRNIREALGREDARFVVSVRSELAEIIGQVYAAGFAPPPGPVPEPQPVQPPEQPHVIQASEPVSGPVPVQEPPAPEPPAHAPAPEPLAEMPAVSEVAPWQNGSGATEHVELHPTVLPAAEPAEPPAASIPQPVPAAEPVSVPQPPIREPAQPAFEEPAQSAFQVPAPEPAPDASPVSFPEPAPIPEPTPVPEAPPLEDAPSPDTMGSDPGEAEAVTSESTTYRLSLRLTNGERVDAGIYGNLEAAKQQAKALMAQVAAADGGDWPFVNGRFIKPDTIVSVDIL